MHIEIHSKSIIKILVYVSAVFALTGCAQTGLHNSTKAFTSQANMRVQDWSDPGEMERTWQAALVRVPKQGGGYISTTMSKMESGRVSTSGVWPTVVYLHGCSGIWPGTYTRINFLAKNGYAVVAPASFARKKYPRSCQPETHKGGMYRPTLKIRQYDAGYAIAKTKTLPWVDNDNVFLMGLSEGGITTATFLSLRPIQSVRARVVEGWTCNSGWSEYRGINAPDNEPVLTLSGKNDPWFQKNRWTRGSCEKFINKSNSSKSVVYSTGSLSTKHELLESREVQKTVLEFLKKHQFN